MSRSVSAALAALLAATVCVPPCAWGQAAFSDPANLGGERVAARDGRELPVDQGALGLEQMLRKLNTRASLMLIVAHPDDEDGGMLTLYSRGLGARVATLTLTRGEGGQNAMTGDFEDALGLLRTQELLSADRYSGTKQMFGTEVDFGFSKTKSEAFSKWTHERVLYDAVRAVRIYRPLVIAAVFVGGVTDGHGQHQVSGEIAQEVFKAAGDPNVFPELTREGILPWKPLKMYARVPMQAITAKGLFDYATNQYIAPRFTNYITGVTSATPPTPDITIHEGTRDPLLTARSGGEADGSDQPLSYVQFARMGLGLQKSQIGPNVRVPPAGRFDIRYHLYGSRVCGQGLTSPTPDLCSAEAVAAASGRASEPMLGQPEAVGTEPSFFSGVDTSVTGMATLAPKLSPAEKEQLRRLAAQLEQAGRAFRPESPQAEAPLLADALHTANELVASVEGSSLPAEQRADLLHELWVKQAQLNEALALALGLKLDATAQAADQVVGSRVPVWIQLTTAAGSDLTMTSETVENSRGTVFKPAALDEAKRDLGPEHAIRRSFKLEPEITMDVTRPYFSRKSIEAPVYDLAEPEFRNAPATPAALRAWADVDYRGVTVRVGRVVHAGPQPVSLVPPVSVHLVEGADLQPVHAQVIPNGEKQLDLALVTEPATVKLKSEKIAGPRGWHTSRTDPGDAAAGDGRFEIRAPQPPRESALLTGAATTADGHTFTEGYRAIGYGDLPRTNYFTPATDRVVPVDLLLPPASERRIGYLPGTGDAVSEALASIGLKPTILTVADLTPEKLARFDTVVLGVRTYNAHPELHGGPTQALLEYARRGGNVVVQYQTYEFTAADAPYPLTLGSAEKVVDETAPVMLLDKSSPLLSYPNTITPADFNGWIEERGHGFLGSWDGHYTALTETHDPGSAEEGVAPQLPQRGGLITTPVGKGRWTYVAFALYRQLPEAVPGAFRLFVNLLTPPAPQQ